MDHVVHTDYGQLTFWWGDADEYDGDVNRFFGNQVNGLVGAADSEHLAFVLARRSGGSAVRVLMEPSQPPVEDDYQDVVEVSVEVSPGQQVRWSAWAGEDGGSLSIPPGQYRLRVSAKGRDEGAQGEFAESVVDWYLIQLWPHPVGEDAVIRTGSDDARYWHEQRGSRRS